jgi:hypothetical protein
VSRFCAEIQLSVKNQEKSSKILFQKSYFIKNHQNVSTFPNTFAIVSPLTCVFLLWCPGRAHLV